MKKAFIRLCAFILAVIIVIPFTVAAEDSDIIIDYSEIFNCVVNGLPTAVWERIEKDGKKLLRVRPDTDSELFTGTNSKKAISLDSWGLDKYKIDLTKYRFVTIEYKYTSKDPLNVTPKLDILKQKVLSRTAKVTADHPIVSGRTANITFFIPDISDIILTPNTPYISQLHFLPFGDTAVCELDAADELLIGKITFTQNDPSNNRSFTVTVDGNSTAVYPGNTFTLPKSKKKDGFIFKGYIPASSTKELMQPGDSIKVESNITFTSYFVPDEVFTGASDIVYGNFKTYYNCIVDGKDTGFADKDSEFLTAWTNPSSSNKGMQLKLDGWGYGGMRIAPTVHKYAYVLMKVEGTSDIRPAMHVMKGTTFSGAVFIQSDTCLDDGVWTFAEFDVSELEDRVIDATVSGFVTQIHFLPFGKKNISDIPTNAKVYIDKIIFSKHKLSPLLHDAFIGGYPDGTFKPEADITRAECAALVLRASGIITEKGLYESFDDVNDHDWHRDIVSTLCKKGIIEKGNTFRPSEPATRAEFTDMIYRTGLKKGTVLGSFTDVFPEHKYYNSIREAAGAGIIGGYSDGTFKPDANITRAEAAKIISNLTERSAHVEELSSLMVFTDIPEEHWCKDIINELAVRHIENNGEIIITDAALKAHNNHGGVSASELEVGNKKKKDVDALFEQKKKAILESTTNVTVKGTKYYVSNDGSDENDGLSPKTPWKTVEKVNATKFKDGDGVFFRRGDLWRTGLVCDKGVTYSAYGEGQKPRFYGSPENGAVPANWTLMSGTDNIWVYHCKMNDVGGIVLNEGERVAEKIAPRFLNGVFFNTANEFEFDIKLGLTEDLTFFCDIPVKDQKAPEAVGYIYLRCDKGNPGEIYDSIEFIAGHYGIYFPKADTVVDNLCAMYCHGGINGSFTVINATVQNCEVGYVGGHLQGYDVFSGTNGTPTRYGNGINFYGECDGYYVYNNYIHDVYDAGISNQYAKGGTNAVRNDNIEYSGNIIERCNYGIEYFMGSADAYVDRIMTNMHIHDNIIRDTGYGFGRKNPSAAAAIKGWDHNNHAEDFTITNNIFCNSYAYLYHIGATYTQWLPTFSNNVYIQKAGAIFGKYGRNPTEQFMFDPETSERIKEALSEDNAEFYYFE